MVAARLGDEVLHEVQVAELGSQRTKAIYPYLKHGLLSLLPLIAISLGRRGLFNLLIYSA